MGKGRGGVHRDAGVIERSRDNVVHLCGGAGTIGSHSFPVRGIVLLRTQVWMPTLGASSCLMSIFP